MRFYVLIMILCLWQITLYCELIHDAVQKGDLEKVKYLVQQGANVNAKRIPEFSDHDDLKEATPIFYTFDAIRFYPRVFKYLVKEGANVNAKAIFDRTPLHFAAAWGNFKAVEALSENGANVNAKSSLGETPLSLAIKNRQTKIVNYLKRKGAE